MILNYLIISTIEFWFKYPWQHFLWQACVAGNEERRGERVGGQGGGNEKQRQNSWILSSIDLYLLPSYLFISCVMLGRLLNLSFDFFFFNSYNKGCYE